MENWAKIFRKICPKTCSKHFWILLGTVLCVFGWNFENFLIFFEKFRRPEPPWNTGITFFFGKICPKASSKHVWTLLVTIFGFFGTLKILCFFLKIFEDSTPHGKLGKNFSKKLPQKMFKTLLDSFGNGFVRFWLEF